MTPEHAIADLRERVTRLESDVLNSYYRHEDAVRRLDRIEKKLIEADDARTLAGTPSAPVDDNEGHARRDAEPVSRSVRTDNLVACVAGVIQTICDGDEILIITEPDLIAAVQKLLTHDASPSSVPGSSEATGGADPSGPVSPSSTYTRPLTDSDWGEIGKAYFPDTRGDR